MVSSRSPGVSVTCNNNSTVDVANKNDLAVNNTNNTATGEESEFNPRNDNERILNNERTRWNSESGPPSFSMSIDLNHHDSGSFSASPDPNNASSCEVKVTRNHEEEERYEAFGSVEGDCDEEESPGGSSSAPSPTGPASLRNPKSPNSTIGRHSWLRTSLRRTGTNRKRLSSNALASQLYRSSSFNSSGRGSICDTGEEMYSDVSLEDDVLDLSHRVQMIQEQMHALADTHSVGEERYARAKEQNATLQARVLMLEEAAKDAESRADERLQAEQRRHRDFACRLEREKELQLENCSIKLQAMELESASLRDEVSRLREQLEKVRQEKGQLENSLDDARRDAEAAQELVRQAVSRSNEAKQMLEVAREELAAHVDEQQKLDALMQEISHLRTRNKSLEESRDELQAAAALQAGRELLMLNPCANNVDKGSSLAAELLAGMNQDQTDGSKPREPEPRTLAEWKQALKEQQEVSSQLRSYIDGILLNIVENYPQLLEVKQLN
ncbi:rab11 family-interacting protein 4A [Leptopilina heterotoma]|uniref:rab11 family-interacting protein 4A n=1 Tax=Leptopilina heterotoma TaxID=63436 RepID=UPI001CA8D4B7|nr:rab11 family-interacting protein 4A [Leptopilina heterotoma]XP_043463113.1 rab11 family-interacting protein 4A [Leptopilina heterotoma]XP_043463114.1 rab11 family-interacting protein 4A [Leptopilina heterotoma]XP_043463115.1 rab11 family-interacting protein 4A [Leptopilina heterotoma]